MLALKDKTESTKISGYTKVYMMTAVSTVLLYVPEVKGYFFIDFFVSLSSLLPLFLYSHFIFK